MELTHNWPLFYVGLFHFCSCATSHSSYIIDNVGLTIVPKNTVQTGTNVTFRCAASISRDTASEPTYHFQFTKDDVTIAASDSQDAAAQYQLFPARAADSGIYGCHVTVEDRSRNSLEETFTVVGLQKPVLWLNKTTVFESEEVVARCSAPSEKGSLIFYFHQRFRSGSTQEVKRAKSRGNSLETKLTLRNIGDSHLYCDYDVPLVGRSNHSNELQVIVQGMFINPVMNVLPSADVYEGDVVEVVCKVVGTRRNVDVFLIKDKKILKSAVVSLSHRFRAQDGDSGELVCKAEWGALQKETYQKITVKELISKPRLSMDPKDVFEGDHLRMTCSVLVYVPERIQNNTLKYFIYKDRTEAKRGNVYKTLAQASENGNYTCKVQATSSGSSFVKESKTLVVKAKVPVSKPSLSVAGARLVLGKPFQLLCQSNKGSLPITYTLYGPRGSREVRVVTNPGETAIFNTTVAKIPDLDNFLCQAKNHLKNPPETVTGQQLSMSTTIIEPVSKPDLSSTPAAEDITERHDVTLFCSVLRGSPPVTFTWYSVGNDGALASQTSQKLRSSFVISEVGSQHNGGYYCVCTNSAKDAKRSNVVTIAVKMAGWKKAVIAIVCLLLLVALILVIVFKKRLIGLKRKRSGELSVKSAGAKLERLSLTQSEVTNLANATPSMMGKSVWSERVSGSESENESSVSAPKTSEVDYAEVQTKEADPSRPPVKKGTDTTYSEVRVSRAGVPEPADSQQTSVAYAELNHDADATSGGGNHDDHTVHEQHREDACADNGAAGTDTGPGHA